MRYQVTLEGAEEGGYMADCGSLGLSAQGLTPANALDALRQNIRYHLEFCPCSTMVEADIELEVL